MLGERDVRDPDRNQDEAEESRERGQEAVIAHGGRLLRQPRRLGGGATDPKAVRRANLHQLDITPISVHPNPGQAERVPLPSQA